MTIAQIIALIVQSLPMVEALVNIIDKEKKSAIPEVVALAAKIIPNIAALVQMIETIRAGTETEHAAIWAPVKARWDSAFAKWNAGTP